MQSINWTLANLKTKLLSSPAEAISCASWLNWRNWQCESYWNETVSIHHRPLKCKTIARYVAVHQRIQHNIYSNYFLFLFISGLWLMEKRTRNYNKLKCCTKMWCLIRRNWILKQQNWKRKQRGFWNVWKNWPKEPAYRRQTFCMVNSVPIGKKRRIILLYTAFSHSCSALKRFATIANV